MTLVYHLFTLELCTSLWQGATYVSTHVPMLTPHVASKLLFVIFIQIVYVCVHELKHCRVTHTTSLVTCSFLWPGACCTVYVSQSLCFSDSQRRLNSITEQQLYYECVIVRLSVLVQLECSQACCCHVYG